MLSSIEQQKCSFKKISEIVDQRMGELGIRASLAYQYVYALYKTLSEENPLPEDTLQQWAFAFYHLAMTDDTLADTLWESIGFLPRSFIETVNEFNLAHLKELEVASDTSSSPTFNINSTAPRDIPANFPGGFFPRSSSESTSPMGLSPSSTEHSLSYDSEGDEDSDELSKPPEPLSSLKSFLQQLSITQIMVKTKLHENRLMIYLEPDTGSGIEDTMAYNYLQKITRCCGDIMIMKIEKVDILKINNRIIAIIQADSNELASLQKWLEPNYHDQSSYQVPTQFGL